MTSSILACLKRDLSSLWLQLVLKILSRCWQLRGCDTTYIALSSSKRQDQFHADPANYICTMWSLSSCCCSLGDLSLQPSQGLEAELVSFTRHEWGSKAKRQSMNFSSKGLSCPSLMANRNTEGPVLLSRDGQLPTTLSLYM